MAESILSESPAIPLELLQKFCSQDKTRAYLMTPFSSRDFTFATDGRVLIRVRRIEGVREAADTDIDVVRIKTIHSFFAKESPGKWVDLPKNDGTWAQDCVDCGGKKVLSIIRCDECDHLIKLEKPIICPHCDGSGKSYNMVRVPFGNRSLNAEYLIKLALLPKVRMCLGGDETEVVAFTFDGGDGRLMPMRK